MCLYITGSFNKVLSSEHKKEMKRFVYNCQVFGVYEWEGCNPLPPEFWLLPTISPVHPGFIIYVPSRTCFLRFKIWNLMAYARLVYMPMSYIYGKKFVGSLTPLVHSLRKELYTQPYCEINWNKARNTIAKEDLYVPHTMVQDMVFGFLYYFAEPLLKRWPFSKLREKATEVAIRHVHYEDINSRYLCIGEVEKVLCLLACWVEDPNSDAYKRHIARIPDYFWVAEDGLKLQSVGTQTWEAALAVQGILASGLTQEYAPTLRKAHDFLKAAQVRDNPSGNFRKMHRHITKGAWTLEVPDHGWQVSDCTAEGLKSETGGYPAWEPKLAFRWMEKFNPTEMFEDVFIEIE
ncbi:hypothetical protein Cgig2_024405 [Carnegiea gigantea]|uniref:Squalene cyclase N-terminal domain-containing protein n=1 Tax=Carnegiea gigantea TaxID=171969 RepID=A0A9Q1QKL7_9CARY|nr:hypothetical protein Cgig2_024405 [Carnegiea gigantea]